MGTKLVPIRVFMELKELKEINKQIADEVYGSAFYYGNLTELEWITILTKLLNQATERGWVAAGGKIETEKISYFLDNI